MEDLFKKIDVPTYVAQLDLNYSGVYVFGIDVSGINDSDSIMNYCLNMKAILEDAGLAPDQFVIVPCKGDKPLVAKANISFEQYIKAIENKYKERGTK